MAGPDPGARTARTRSRGSRGVPAEASLRRSIPQFIPHVTVARGTETELDRWETELQHCLPDLAEPLLVDTIVAEEQPSGHWAVTHYLPLGRGDTPWPPPCSAAIRALSCRFGRSAAPGRIGVSAVKSR